MSTAVEPTPSLLSPIPRPARPTWLGVPVASWAKVTLLAIAFAAVYRYNLIRLWEKTNPRTGDPNWSHAICVPLIGLYYLLLHRDELRGTPARPLLAGNWSRRRVASAACVMVAGAVLAWGVSRLIPQTEGLWLLRGIIENIGFGLLGFGVLGLVMDWGLATLFGGLLLSAYGIFPGYNDFIWDSGMIITLFGVVLTLCGWDIMRIVWFPIAFLFCALPWPGLVYSQIASPLQVLAARVSVAILQLVGVDASYGGTKIFMPQFAANGIRLEDRSLNVAEACAGLRSLMTFISVAAAVAFLNSNRSVWQKLLITACAVPIAISCNVMRVAGQGLLDLYVGREWSEGFAHQFAGMVMLLPAFFLVMLVCWVVDHLFIEEVADTTTIIIKPAAAKQTIGTTPTTGATPAAGGKQRGGVA